MFCKFTEYILALMVVGFAIFVPKSKPRTLEYKKE